MAGTYVLVVTLARSTTVEVGALGPIAFEAGKYAYVGSAFGPGGFSRIDRHRSVASGERTVRHWHVDYLLGHREASLERVVTFPEEDRECELADELPGNRVADFGASDCDCRAHLLSVPDADALVDAATAEGGIADTPGERTWSGE